MLLDSPLPLTQGQQYLCPFLKGDLFLSTSYFALSIPLSLSCSHMQQCKVLQPAKQGVGQGETFLIHLMATAFGLLRTMLNTINKTPILCEIFYILILQGACKNGVSESGQFCVTHCYCGSSL